MKPRRCPWCHGEGGWVDIIADGQGPKEICGFCNGTGEIRNKRLFYQALGWLSGLKRAKKEDHCVIQRAEYLRKGGVAEDDNLWK